MRKIRALLLLAMFVIGMLPVAFAAQASDTGQVQANSETAPSANDAALTAREKIRERLEANQETIQNRVENRADVLETQKARVDKLVQACAARGVEEAKCREIFGQRLESLQKLAPKLQEKLQQFTALREKRVEKLKELKSDKNLAKIKREIGFRARAIEKGKLEGAKAALLVAKEKVMSAKGKLEAAKLRLEKAKLSTVCKGAPDSEDCTKSKDELRASAKEKVHGDADAIIEHLLNIKAYVEANEALSDEEAAEIIAYLDERITLFKGIKAEIDAAETKDQIVAAAKKLKEAWQEHRQKVNAYAVHVSNSNMAGIIVKSTYLQAKLERVLERMTENGKDTASVEPLVAQFKEKIELAKSKFDEAQKVFVEVKSAAGGADISGKVQQAQGLMKESRTALQDASKLLKDIFQKLKEVGATKELADAADAEDVEVADEEADASTAVDTTSGTTTA